MLLSSTFVPPAPSLRRHSRGDPKTVHVLYLLLQRLRDHLVLLDEPGAAELLRLQVHLVHGAAAAGDVHHSDVRGAREAGAEDGDEVLLGGARTLLTRAIAGRGARRGRERVGQGPRNQ